MKKILLALVLTLAAALPARAQVAIDASTTATADGAAVSPLTWTHTVGVSGTNRFILVTVSDLNAATAVSYNSVALTPLVTTGLSLGIQQHLQSWYGVAPATGAHAVSVTFPAGSNVVAGATSFTGVDQTTPLAGPFVGTSENSGAGDSRRDPNLWDSDVLASVYDATSNPAALALLLAGYYNETNATSLAQGAAIELLGRATSAFTTSVIYVSGFMSNPVAMISETSQPVGLPVEGMSISPGRRDPANAAGGGTNLYAYSLLVRPVATAITNGR